MKNLIFLGDSITDCDRLWDERPEPLGSGYVRVIRENLPRREYKLTNRGHNGYTAWQVNRCLEEDCLSRNPDMVSILVGINDVYARLWNSGGYDAREYGDILTEMIIRIQERCRCEILVMEPFLFPWPDEMRTWMDTLEEFAGAAREAAAGTGVHFLELRKMWKDVLLREDVRSLTTDGIHLTLQGHKILAEEWLKFYLFRSDML